MNETGLSACLIVKDAASMLEATLASVRPYVAEVCIYDTGSRDETLELVAGLAARPGAPIVCEAGEWRDDFAWAREQSFALSSQPWRMYLDADDVLVGGGRLAVLVAAAGAAGARGISVAYDHHDGPDGTTVWLWTNRIVRRDSGHWEGVVHEHWRGLRLEEIAVAHPAAVRLRHRSRSERPGRYTRLVERAAADPAVTPRGMMMLGFELLRRDDRRAVEALAAYLDGGHDELEGTPNGYRWVVLDQLAQAEARLGDEAAAAHWSAARDRYTRELSAAIEVGAMEDPEYWRSLLGRMEELVSLAGADSLLPGPASSLPSEKPRVERDP